MYIKIHNQAIARQKNRQTDKTPYFILQSVLPFQCLNIDHEFYKLEKVDSEQRDLHFMHLLRDFTSVKHCPIPSFPGDGKANDIISFFSRMCEVMRKNIAYSRKYYIES